MKRIFAIIITVAMVFSFASVFAAETDAAAGFEQAMMTQYTSGAVKMNVGLSIGGSMLEQDEDFKQIKELLDDMSIAYDLKVKSNEEQTKVESSGSISIISDVLSRYFVSATEGVEAVAKGDIPDSVNYDMWLDLDISDAENPKYYVIMTNPVVDKYMVMDMGEMLSDSLIQIQEMGMLDTEKALEISKKIYTGIETNVKFADGRYTMSMTDAELKAAIGKFATNLFDVLTEFGLPQEELVEIKEGMAFVMAQIADIQLFNKDEAFVLTCDVDENNLCTGMSFALNFDMNIYDIMQRFAPGEIEGESRDNWGFEFGISADMKYEELPEDFVVEYPVLSPENCDNFISYYNVNAYEEADYETPITVNFNGKQIEFDEQPMLFRNRTMVPIRALANAIGITDENISYDEATERIVLKGDGKEIVMHVGSQYAYLNGELKTFDVPAVENNGRAYIPARAISEFFGKTVDYADLAEKGGVGLIVDIND